jgi:hypothetical protein
LKRGQRFGGLDFGDRLHAPAHADIKRFIALRQLADLGPHVLGRRPLAQVDRLREVLGIGAGGIGGGALFDLGMGNAKVPLRGASVWQSVCSKVGRCRLAGPLGIEPQAGIPLQKRG